MNDPGNWAGAVRRAFQTAFLLSGNMAVAEAAVIDGIDACCPDSDADGLFSETVKSAIRRSGGPSIPGMALPAELSPVLMLDRTVRHCFVMRVLVGYGLQECCRLLRLSADEVEEAVARSIREVSRRQPADQSNSTTILPAEPAATAKYAASTSAAENL